jgi:diguanylate cyclase (GGDEF)-like protein/PAS domain S-box-containing protein
MFFFQVKSRIFLIPFVYARFIVTGASSMPHETDFYKNIIDNLYDGVYFVDRDRKITYWNRGAERITGYAGEQVVGRHCRDNLLNHVTANGVSLCQDHCPLAAVMQDGNPREAEVYLHHANGHRVPVMVRATALRDEAGNIVGAVETFSNNSTVVSVRRRLNEMHQIARTDSLTRIGNRQHVEGRIRAVIAEFENGQSMAGLLFMDIDHFKRINDTYGHDVGDLALCMVSNTLRLALRVTDSVGRWGGEEFVAILYDISNEAALFATAEKVRSLIESSRLDIEGHSLTVTASIGATLLYSNDTPESLVRRADSLMYRSKQAGGNRVIVG